MIEKYKILEAWIMVEHLSEGDISLKDRAILTLNDLQGQDFYSLFLHEIEKKKWNQRQKGGVVVYFDVFKFREVVDILRAQYRLKPTDEDIRLGDKFSFALYFDRNLNFLADMTFFTESAYIRYFKKIPHAEEFREFEENLKNQFLQDFDETVRNPAKFNAAIQKELLRYGIDVTNCRMQILGNIETEATNLHSFFIDDLEKAKKIKTANLNAYLYGNKEGRKNLDSKKDSVSFNPHMFEQILQPKNYPLGRFPGNTIYALSLMQQVAVNLSVGFDNNQIRSVNGPPGTGKTTLLKDIFAQIVVQQAYDIVKLSDHFIKGSEKTIYFNYASIGEIPEYITENNIVVASSNNGAVQNIVNELPLSKEIDNSLIEELKEADYFREISNANVWVEWLEDENGKKREELVKESVPGEEKFWGVFSLEGGKTDNMTNILTNMKHIHKYLEEEYLPDQDIYKEFLKHYEEVKVIQTRRQAFADSIRVYQECIQKLEQACGSYQKELGEKENQLCTEIHKLAETERECGHRLEQLKISLREVQNRAEIVQKNMTSMDKCLQMHKEQRPGFFAGKKKKEEYRSRLNEITSQLVKLSDEDTECSKQEKEINNNILLHQMELRQSTEKQEKLQQNFNSWKMIEAGKISNLKKRVCKYEDIRNNSKTQPLNMNQEYDDLQLSNPWFDEAYRVAQSKLFVMALRVRKQFLYENRKNIKAAIIVWGQQEKYLERKPVIEAAWNWINMTIPVISSTFASFSRMCRNLGAETLGHLFIDEAGQALPQAAVGAVYRSRHVMVVGDPLQIKPVLTLDSNTLYMLGRYFGVTEKYLSASASVQTLVDAASQYGFYRNQDKSEESWVGIPLWVHRRCQYPMFTISNMISYDGFMVQGTKEYGKTGWFDVGGTANNKYVEEQGEFLLQKLREMIEKNSKILDKKEKDVIYVITPFSNVAYQLSQKLRKIHFTRYDEHGKPTNVGTVHTFQGKEAPIVFFVLGADQQSSGAARWAVTEANIMNVAATRAKEEFYIIGDRKLYLGLGCDVVTNTDRIIRQYKNEYPDLVDDQVSKTELCIQTGEARIPVIDADLRRITGTVKYVGRGSKSFYAYVLGADGKEYSITENIYSKTEHAIEVVQKGKKISFIPEEVKKKLFATKVKMDV
ncbi:DEAD/DEAH box helicase [Mediterraneibacter agrestimuris]|uniref:DEAD/DEAH box helicase n=1 Tax=Mediterraneibacter agrestimuris TaxID=2941333 RepID=UPI002041A896|nr:AAA domain-containing protein [Mediterraneibacter agrestimuris]